MTELEKYEAVNKCETIDELRNVILSFMDSDGMIKGRTRHFHAEKMANYVYDVVNGNLIPNVLTREFGIRQQALYLRYYNLT